MRFLRLLAKRLQFALAPDPVENSRNQRSYPDWHNFSDEELAIEYSGIVIVNDEDFVRPIAEDAWRGFGWPATRAGGAGLGRVPTHPVTSTFHSEGNKL